MSDELQGAMYSLWLVFLGIYFLQDTVTGSLRRRRGRSADAVWPIPKLGEIRVPNCRWFIRGSRRFCFPSCFSKVTAEPGQLSCRIPYRRLRRYDINQDLSSEN